MSKQDMYVKVDHGAYLFGLYADNDTVRPTLIIEATKLGAMIDDEPSNGPDRRTIMSMPLDHPAEAQQFMAFCAAQGCVVEDGIIDQIEIPNFAALRNTSEVAHGGKVTQQMIGSMMRTINGIAMCYQAREQLGLK